PVIARRSTRAGSEGTRETLPRTSRPGAVHAGRGSSTRSRRWGCAWRAVPVDPSTTSPLAAPATRVSISRPAAVQVTRAFSCTGGALEGQGTIRGAVGAERPGRRHGPPHRPYGVGAVGFRASSKAAAV